MKNDKVAALIEQRKVLREKQENIQTEIDELDRQVETVLLSLSEEYQALSLKKIQMHNNDAHDLDSSFLFHLDTSRSVRRNAGRKDIEPCVTSILSQQNRPLSTKKLYEKVSSCLSQKRCAIGGKRPEANFSAHLSHIDSVTNISGHGWILIDNPKTFIYLHVEPELEWNSTDSHRHEKFDDDFPRQLQEVSLSS